MEKYKIQVSDTHCNICGKELSGQEKQNETAIRERLGFGSGREDEEHRVRWCQSCFGKLISDCKISPQVQNFTEIQTEDEPGHFCNLCEKELDAFDLQDKLAVQGKSNGQKYRIRLCQGCFSKIIDGCKIDSYINYWGNESHLQINI